MKWTIFFDLDGTLIDTSERHYRIYKDILYFYDAPDVLTKEEFWKLKRNGRKTTELLPETSKEFIQQFSDEWLRRIESRRYLRLDKPLPECPDTLLILKDVADLILVTLRNNEENLLWELDNFGLTKYFRKILVGSPLKINAKIPMITNYFKEHSKKGKFIIVGDTEVDIYAGKEFRILTVAVTYGIRSKEFLEKLDADFYLDNIANLPKVLEKIGGES